MAFRGLPTTGSVIRRRTNGARPIALFAVVALLNAVNLIGAGPAGAAAAQSTTVPFGVKKVDAVTGTPLAGAHFTFFDHLNGVIGMCLTDGTGSCHIDGTTNFSYQVQEDAPPPGYTAQPGVVTAPVITNPQDNPPLVFRDQPSGTSLQQVLLQKVDAATRAPLASALFKLDGFVGETETCWTDAQGMCRIVNVPQGDYAWRELVAPNGYDLVTTTSAVSVKVGQTPPVVTVADQTSAPASSTLTVTKYDARTHEVLAGAQFELRGANATCTTDVNGECSISGLSLGTYSWRETQAPTGYLLGADSAAIQITDANAGTTFEPTAVADAEIATDLTVLKVDASDPGRALAGAKFTLIGDDSAVVGRCTTAPDGRCTVQNLTFGTYTWTEVQPPAGYDLPDQPRSAPIDVTAANAGTTMPTTVVADELSRSTLRLKKVDAADHTSPVAGATYRLYRESNGVDGLQATGVAPSTPDSRIGECTTAVDGTCSIDSLPNGTYFWLEVSAPPGYALSAQPSDAVVVTASSAVTTTVSDARLGTPSASSQTSDQGGGLAFTGSNVLAMVSGATALLAAGGLLLWLTNRRRRTI
jgi:uncharacterized surface anchored protein